MLRFAGGTLFAMICSAAACSLDASGIEASTQTVFGAGGAGGGGGNGTTTNVGGYGGSLTISAGGGTVATATGTAGGEGGAGGGNFVCEGEGVFVDLATGHCYRHVLDGVDWSSAEANCKMWGGQSATLAAISSAEEWETISEELGLMLDTWVGGRNLPDDAVDDYEWSNGEPWEYAPNGMLPANVPSKPCIKLKDLELQPKACNEMHESLCERY